MELEKKSKGFFGKLAGTLIDMEEEAPRRLPTTRPQQMVAPASMPPLPQPVAAPTQGSEKFVTLLQQGLEERALSTYDYLKFRKAVAGLKAVVFDEGSRYKAAFVSASAAGGVTKTTLLDSTKHYLAALAEEQKEFETKLKQEQEARIGGGQSELANLDQQLMTKNQEVARLNQEIVTLASKRTELSNKIEQDKLLCSQTQASFQAALQTVGQEINSDAQKITTYITE